MAGVLAETHLHFHFFSERTNYLTMKDRELNNQLESLEIISSMIDKTKGKIGKNAAHYLLWGWLGLAASAGQAVLFKMDYDWHFIGWVILMPIGGIVSVIMSRKEKKANYGYMGKVMAFLWGAFTFSILIVMANGFKLGWQNAYVFLIILVGMATFISGSILKFQPLKIGGWFAWAMSGFALYMPMFWTIIAIALVMLVSYLIPGYILKKKYGQEA